MRSFAQIGMPRCIYYNIVKLCFDSLVIRLRSKDLKHLIPIPVYPVSKVSINGLFELFWFLTNIQLKGELAQMVARSTSDWNILSSNPAGSNVKFNSKRNPYWWLCQAILPSAELGRWVVTTNWLLSNLTIL